MIALTLVALVASAQPCDVPVSTDAGLVVGVEDGSDTCAWRGLPYAAPPMHELRWRAPIPPEPWEGVRDGSVWAPRCVQPNGVFARFVNQDPSGQMSEDCLHLNVWRPRQIEDDLPVMVFLHGGGLGMGTANTPAYWGDRLAAAGPVVAVTVNYRLGTLGFLALPALSAESEPSTTGNYGLLDQVAALQWVHDNIASFGGDPERVTVFGESGGSWSTCTLLGSPLAAGLFHGAILQSGACQHVTTLEEGYRQGRELAEVFGCEPDDLQCLRSKPAKQLAKRQPMPTFSAVSYAPHIDGYALHGMPVDELLVGRGNAVPVWAGFTRDEMLMVVRMEERALTRLKAEEYESGIVELYPTLSAEAPRLAELYPLSDYPDLAWAYGAMVSDEGFVCPTFEVASALVSQGQPVFLSRFDYDEHRMAPRWGAHHAVDLPFTFDSLDRKPFALFFTRAQRNRAQGLAKAHNALVASFAGDLPETLSPLDPDEPSMTVIDLDGTSTAPFERTEQCRFWFDHREDTGW